ncbi:MAG TPA: N-acetyl-gamma-glutamyl-phosphate reductase [Trebonia sp.]|jgi:N-acetyl-gamma-glutamyl-phosphate reductase|nr:N-acetyl-gamma-glutamyl-phosphate reductase [Trebonia sp.]
MGIRVAVAGASGYAGGELLRLLAGHPDFEIGAVTGASNAGQPVTSIHPNLTGHPAFDGRLFDATSAGALGDAELIFMALPHGESAALAERLPDARIVDLSADFRLGDPVAWEAYYGVPYAGRWTYGLPELPGARAEIEAARTVAAPGCYATTSILALAPLLATGLAEPDDIVIVAASGTSGAGRSPRSDLLASEVVGSLSAYNAGGKHRHTPEIEQALSELVPAGSAPATVSFTPVLAPMPRGILATCTARLALGVADGPDPDAALRGAFTGAYAGGPFVHVLPGGQWPASGALSGSNGAHVQVAADLHAGRAIVVAALDNLGKGAAGQAVQLANIMLGLPETAGLTTHGVAP